ncbi:hypothetical protein AMTRI_Chr11g154190 [Amborella trichopoda]
MRILSTMALNRHGYKRHLITLAESYSITTFCCLVVSLNTPIFKAHSSASLISHICILP